MHKTTANKPELKVLDLKKDLKHLYNPSTKGVVLVDVPEMQFLMIDGMGDPNTAQKYSDAVSALYSMAYTLKFLIRKELGIDYPVMPLEGLWWVEDMRAFSVDKKNDWLWTMMIMQPDIVTLEHFQEALKQVEQKKPSPALSKIRLERFSEGLAAQIMHIGLYAAEKPTIEKVHSFIKEQGYNLSGKHHEIYLGDPRKSAPEKLKTVIRQPCKK
ncbi:MAG TPA: GyrI-like domain-containing protein [Ktedonobacteraceae bacterium]|jgi:hypothetical protein|nr:GyrI-like domain-containing protein [Ktedonobacteraceae bacterium]